MARYIDADALIEDIQETICGKCGDISDGIKCKSCGIDDTLDFLENAPTADVVPKSEVDLYRKQVDELEDELASTYDKLENAKAEVAREIFEEIERLSLDMKIQAVTFKAIMGKSLDKLKTKYTEENQNEN